MKLTDILNIIAVGWKYSVFLDISDGFTSYSCELTRDMRRGEETAEFLLWLKELDLDVDRIFGDSAICIHTKPVGIVKMPENVKAEEVDNEFES